MNAIPAIREGVFFSSPASLPRGRHHLSRDAILAAQSERLMIAAVELMAAGGYRSISVGDIASRARISRAAFYECFTDKDECVYAAYDRFIALLVERLVTTIQSVSEAGDWYRMVSATIEMYLGTLQADPVVARACQVEMDALGRPARDRRREALLGLAALLKSERDRFWPGAENVPLTVYSTAVHGLRQLASDALDAHPAPDLLDIGHHLAPAIAALLAPNISMAGNH